MKVLILGAGGQLGRALSAAFADQEVLVADLPQCDLADFVGVKDWIISAQPEVIINAAAITDWQESENNQEKAMLINGTAVGNLAKIARDLKIKLIHYSANEVFSIGEDFYNEEAVPNPANFYGQSKLAGEKLLFENYPEAYLIRSSFLYGHDGKNFINQFIENVKNNQEIKVSENQIVCPTYVKDLAEATKKLLLENKPSGIYHLINEGAASLYELAYKIKDILALPTNIVPIKSNDSLSGKIILANTKFSKLRLWTEALEEYLLSLKLN